MPARLDPMLIEEFRKKLTDNCLVRHIYFNYENQGKAYWNAFISATDWISVAVGGVDLYLLSTENNNEASRKMMSFISCIDVLWHGIIRLYQSILDIKKATPFYDDYSIFGQKVTDNQYFETIRALFMAHPVDINSDPFGIKKNKNNASRWYARWSGGKFEDGDFSVYVFSDDPAELPKRFSIDFSQLMEFAEKRYNYLNDLWKIIELNIEEYKKRWGEVIIPKPSDNISDYIDLLSEENEKRFENEYFRNRLNYLKIAFSVTPENQKNLSILNEYRVSLLDEVNRIHQILQNMEIEADFKETNFFIPENLIYPLEKLTEYAPVLQEYAKEKIEAYIGDITDLSSCKDIYETQIIVDAALWKKTITGCGQTDQEEDLVSKINKILKDQ